MNRPQPSPLVNFHANLKPTRILDCEHPNVQEFVRQLRPAIQSPRNFVQVAHQEMTSRLRPVYDLDELQPTSTTLKKGFGSCSQRMAWLEAVSRVGGVPTRVRALHVDGRFWYPRFPWFRAFIPKRVLLVWPQFVLEENWVDFDELFAPISHLVNSSHNAFKNDGESLFEAVQHTPIDFQGKSCGLSCARPE